jgi:FKBP12-rapamycin complex-associated protein
MEGEDNATKMTRFANYLHYVLPGSDTQVMVFASRTLGKLAAAIPTGARTADFVDFEIKRALEWLQQGERVESRRHAAALVTAELAANAPSLIFPYLPQILDAVWIILRDPKAAIRETGADALKACLLLLHQRDSDAKGFWHRKLMEEAFKGVKSGYTENIHGSLLALRQLVRQTEIVDYFKIVFS